jgi:hypothetical protein
METETAEREKARERDAPRQAERVVRSLGGVGDVSK